MNALISFIRLRVLTQCVGIHLAARQYQGVIKRCGSLGELNIDFDRLPPVVVLPANDRVFLFALLWGRDVHKSSNRLSFSSGTLMPAIFGGIGSRADNDEVVVPVPTATTRTSNRSSL
jgi:hypothetical protein